MDLEDNGTQKIDILESEGNRVTSVTREITETKVISTEAHLKPSSPMIKNFVRAYIEQGFQNGAEAARRAGSQAKNPNHVAYMWLQDPWVQRELETAKALLEEGKNPLSIITEDDVLNKLLTVYTMCLADKKYDSAIRSVELMGKHLGMFIMNSHGHTSSKTLTLKETQTLELTQDADRLDHLSQVLKGGNIALGKDAKEAIEVPIEDSI